MKILLNKLEAIADRRIALWQSEHSMGLVVAGSVVRGRVGDWVGGRVVLNVRNDVDCMDVPLCPTGPVLQFRHLLYSAASWHPPHTFEGSESVGG